MLDYLLRVPMQGGGIIMRHCLGYSLVKGLRKSRLFEEVDIRVIDFKNTACPCQSMAKVAVVRESDSNCPMHHTYSPSDRRACPLTTVKI